MNSGLTRVTTEYSEIEDRVIIKGSKADGEVCAVFMTQRLMSRLILHVIQWLESESENLTSGSPSKDSEIKNWLQGSAQEKASASTIDEKPVELSNDSESWLAHEVDIKQRPTGIRFTFKSPSGKFVNLELSKDATRKWLNIIFRVWQIAEWTLAPWPQWMKQSQKKDPIASLPVH